MYGKMTPKGHVELFHSDGKRVTRLVTKTPVWPVGSGLSTAWTHPDGLVIHRENAEKLKIEIRKD